MSDEREALLEATTALLSPLLTGMDMLAQAGRHLHPPHLDSVIEAALPARQPLVDGLKQFEAVAWPDHLRQFHDHLHDAAEATLQGYDGLAACAGHENPIMGAYGSLRFATQATEALYPIAAMLPPVSRFFLDQAHQEDDALLEKLALADHSREGVGIIHAGNDADSRGGFSLYIPEYYDESEDQDWPLVIALHGGSGHGRSFLWTWLKAARSNAVILLSATSRDRTWSLMGPDRDSANIRAMIDHVADNYRLDRSRILLTGMSDGGTFTMLSGLMTSGVPATHLAPISSAFHPVLVQTAPAERLTGLPVYLTHGALDWMFPIDMARAAADALRDAGAAVEFREIEDLSHAYPREENARILEWFLRRD